MKFNLTLQQTRYLKDHLWAKFCNWLNNEHPEHDFTFIEDEDGEWMIVDL